MIGYRQPSVAGFKSNDFEPESNITITNKRDSFLEFGNTGSFSKLPSSNLESDNCLNRKY